MSLFNKKPKKGSQDQIVISAPLGDVRHVSHIGRDGADFGEEHLFVSINPIIDFPGRVARQSSSKVTAGPSERYGLLRD